ncbi:MAG: SpoIID/LytB domain-containing protein [Myxococcota bacterium]
MLLIAALLLTSAEPAPVPTGMELLYGDRLPLGPDGEPTVAIGIATGESRVTLRVRDAQLDFYQRGVLRTAQPRAGATIEVSILRSRKALRRHYVDVAGAPFGDPEGLERAAQDWTARGYDVEVLEEGTALGIGGRVIDTRQYRLVLPTASQESARRLAERVHAETGERAFVKSRIETLPWASLRIDVDGAPIGVATSYARLTSFDHETLTVRDVSFGKGYAHAGREDRHYRGELYVVVDADGRLAVVNVLGAEELLRGVVPSELFASAHPEALRAQAVAARNQLFAKLGTRHHSDPFHLCSHQHCQVYTGTNREDPRTDQAIADTRGELLFHRERLVDTVYSSTCGGHTENNDAVWGNAADPALRGRPDFDEDAHPELASYADGIERSELRSWVNSTPATYCSQASKVSRKKFRWRRAFTQGEIDALVVRRFPQVGSVKALHVVNRGPGGRVMTLRIKGTRGEASLLHELAVRRMFSNLESGAFVIERGTDGGFVFVGGGWGHGVGMCQLGAIGRAESGHDYRSILRHYYNGAVTVPVYGTSISQRD